MAKINDKLHFLMHSAALTEGCLREKLLPLGLGPRQARVLNALERIEPLSQADLARELRITAASMSTMTSRLIAAGLITSEADPQKMRNNMVRLTEKGKSLLDKIETVYGEVDAVIENAIGMEKSEELSRLTKDLRDALGGQVIGLNSEKE